MRFRPLLALVLAFCLTFIAAPSSVSASGERGNSKFADIVNTGKANDCPTVSAGSQGSISIDGGLTDICMHPTEVYVKVARSKRAAVAKISFTVDVSSLAARYVTLNAGIVAIGNVQNGSYTFSIPEKITVSPGSNGIASFENIEILKDV